MTENEHKSMVVLQGQQFFGLTFQRGNKRFILLDAGEFAVPFERRDCKVTVRNEWKADLSRLS